MSAAEKLKSENKIERIALILSSTSPKFPGDAEKVLKKAGYTVTRFVSLDFLLSSPELARPAIVVLEISDETDVQQAHLFLRSVESAIVHGRLKAVFFTSIRHQDLRKRFQAGFVADFFTYPMADRTFVFKLDLQAKILQNVAEAEKKRGDVSFEHHSTEQKPGGRFNLKVVGPPPTRGGWQVLSSSPTGTVRWRWVKKPVANPTEEPPREAAVRDWQYEGKEAPKWDDEEKLWHMESEDPVLEKIENGQKTFSSKTSEWLTKQVNVVDKRSEEQVVKKRSATKTFAGEEPLPVKNLAVKDNTPSTKERAAKEKAVRDSSNVVVDISQRQEASTSRQREETKVEKATFSQETKSNLMDLRSENAETPHEQKANEGKNENKLLNTEAQNPKVEKINTAPSTLEKEASDKAKEPKDQAAALREKFREKSDEKSHGKEAKSGNIRNQTGRSEKEVLPVFRGNVTLDHDETAIKKHDLSQDITTLASPDKQNKPLDAVSLKSGEKKSGEEPAKTETNWNDRRTDGEKIKTREIKDRRADISKKINIEGMADPTSNSQSVTTQTAVDNEETPVHGAAAASADSEKQIETEKTFTKDKRLKKREGLKKSEEKTALPPGREKLFRPEDELVRVTDNGKKTEMEEELRGRSSPAEQEPEIRVRGTTDNQNRDDSIPYRVVKERVHYLKTLEELGDDNSTWERAEIYRVYLGAKKKYYGIETIEEALPIWVYVGESAPEFIERSKSWMFFDNIPVKYTEVADLPKPVLDLLTGLRDRVAQHKLEELRKKTLAEGTEPPKNSEFQPQPKTDVPLREIKLKDVPSNEQSSTTPLPLEKERVESFADKVFSLLINLFKSGRK